MGDFVLRTFAQATEAAAHAPFFVLGLVALIALVGGVVFGIPVEPVLLAASAVAPEPLLFPLALAATLGQMVAKTALYGGGLRIAAALPVARRARIDRACAAFASRPRLQNTTLLASAIVGMPPFYVTTLAYGALRLPLATFVTLGTIGRAIRFTALVFAPRLLVAASALALLATPVVALSHAGGVR